MDMAAHRAARRGAHAPHVSAGGAEPSAALQGVLAAARTAAGKMRVPAQRVNYVVAYVSDAAREVTVAALRHARVVDSVVLPHAGHGAGFEHMSGAIARAIGSMCVPVGPDCEGILLAGDAAASEPLVRALKAAVSHLAPVSTVKPAPEAPRAARQQ
jgi:butyrate kinase